MKKEIMDLKLATVAKYKNNYYMTFLGLNALFEYDTKDEKFFLIDTFQTDENDYCMYIRSFLYGNEIWFLPGKASKIAILNISKRRIQYIAIDLSGEDHVLEPVYNNYIRFKDHFVCCVPRGVKRAIIINMESKIVEDYYEISKGNEEFQNAVLIDNTLIFYPWQGNQKVLLNLLSKKIIYQKWEGNEKYGDAVYDKKSGKIFHAPARENNMLIDDFYGNVLERKVLNIPLNNEGYHTFYSSTNNDEILFWGIQGVISINIRENTICYFQVREDDNGIILIPIDSAVKEAYVYGGNRIVQFDKIQKKYTAFEVTMTCQELIDQIEKTGKKFHEIYGGRERSYEIENEMFTLNNFIRLIKSNLLAFEYNNKRKHDDFIIRYNKKIFEEIENV